MLAAADRLRAESVGEGVSHIVNCNINYTNICLYACRFCAFSKGTSSKLRGKPYDLDLDEIARRAITWAGTYAPGNVAARRMAESVAQELQRLAIAAGVPGGERVGASIVPLMPSSNTTQEAR